MSSPSKIRVLQDLSMATLGFGGIPQDTRLMFKTFTRMPGVEVEGLLLDNGGKGRSIARPRPGTPLDSARAVSTVLADGEAPGILRSAQRLPVLGRLVGLAASAASQFTRNFWTAPVETDLVLSAIWRAYFAKTLFAEDRGLVSQQRFHLTNLDLRRAMQSVFLPWCPPPRLDTMGFDVLVTSDLRPYQVSPGTTQVMRFHDPIPLAHADTHIYGDLQYRLLRNIPANAQIVCNSDTTLAELLSLLPELENRASRIYYALPDKVLPLAREIEPRSVIRQRLSASSLGGDKGEKALEAVRTKLLKEKPRYILGVSTLEPRKNFQGLIQAWDIARHRGAPDLKLVIVGKPGWLFEDTLRAMRPYVATGDIYHVESLPIHEVQALYIGAQALVFPSFAEGFGFPPMESLLCGTPAVVSDIPVHREVMGDAVLYADPYDAPGIAEQILRLAGPKAEPGLRETLVGRAAPILHRYTVEAVSEDWQRLFERIKGRAAS